MVQNVIGCMWLEIEILCVLIYNMKEKMLLFLREEICL
jgi:hypothetical protein